MNYKIQFKQEEELLNNNSPIQQSHREKEYIQRNKIIARRRLQPTAHSTFGYQQNSRREKRYTVKALRRLHTDKHQEGAITDMEMELEQYSKEYHNFNAPNQSSPACLDVLCNKFEALLLNDMQSNNEKKYAPRENKHEVSVVGEEDII
ncbi:hypothetical protein GWI33_011764, partial [Rhynchophorus ferrugineus]